MLQDLRFAARTLSRMRGVGVVAVFTLALGIGAATTMFGVVDAALLRPPPFAEPERLALVYVTRTSPRDGLTRLRWSRPAIATLESTAPASFDAVASFSGANVSIGGGGDVPEQLDGEVVSPAYFGVLRVVPAAGRVFLPSDDAAPGAPAIAVVSDRLWRRRFEANPSLVGQTIRVNDVPLTVVGILPPGFAGLSGKADVWIPRTMAPRLTYAEYLTTPQHFISVVARVRQGSSVARADAELAAIGGRFADAAAAANAAATGTWSAMALPLGEARVDPALRRSVLVLLAAAGCVLLIACVNVAGLLLARARTRRREIAIRLAIGSSRRRLVQLLLAEGLVIAAIAGALGTVLAAWGVAVCARLSPGVIASFGNDYAAVASFAAPVLDVRVLVFAMAATFATTLLCGLVPALDASRPQLVSALKEDERGGGHGRALSWLVVSEVGLAVLLLAAAGLLVETFAHMQRVRGGFETDRILTFWIRPPTSRYAPADGPAIVERMLTRIEQVPGVETAAVNRATPFMGGSRTVLTLPDRPLDGTSPPPIGRHYVSADYFRTLGVPLLSGRVLTRADRAGSAPVTVINETAARRFWPGENPIGKHVRFGATTGFTDPARPVEIVGVVGDVKYDGIGQPMNADFYTSYLQFCYPDTIVIVKTSGPSAALTPALRAAVASVDPAVPIFDVMTLDDRIAGALSRPRFNAAFVALFAAIALTLAAIGVYSVLSYSVSSRMREIGVRLALGAGARRVIGLVLGEGLRLAAAGAVLGVAAALAVTRLMQGLLAGVAPADPLVLVTGAAVVFVVAGAAAFLPARRASAVDPIVVLRND